MKVEILRSTFTDNYFYLLTSGGDGLLVDPIDAAVANAAVEAAGVSLRYVFNTHFHPDHVGGDDAVLKANPGAELVVAFDDADRIQESVNATIDRRVGSQDTIQLGQDEIEVLETPGHTLGHVSLRFGKRLFSGDTIFSGGAGHCRFGGEVGLFFRTYRDVITQLDDDVTFYPGHDYAAHNLEFALSIQPELEAATAALARVRKQDGLGLTTIGMERSYNPFFRFAAPDLAAALKSNFAKDFSSELAISSSEEEAVFRSVRRLRNRW